MTTVPLRFPIGSLSVPGTTAAGSPKRARARGRARTPSRPLYRTTHSFNVYVDAQAAKDVG